MTRSCVSGLYAFARNRLLPTALAALGIVSEALGVQPPVPQPLPPGYDEPLTIPPVIPAKPFPTTIPQTPTLTPGMPSSRAFQSATVNASQPTTVVAGRTPATFSVNSTGAADYTIPLWSPPGVGTTQLALSLTYSNRTPDGALGVGWSVAGLSVISRCNRTWVQDGVTQGVSLYGLTDRLCLDGQQLKVTSGSTTSPAQGGTIFATEIETFSRVVALGSAGSAPTGFTVTSKNGLIYDYGTTTDSRILGRSGGPVRSWALAQIRDRVGNAIRITYQNDAQPGTFSSVAYRVKEIDYPYTANAQGPFYSIIFNYGPRPTSANTPIGYITGGLVMEPNELNSISIQDYGSSTPIKAYYLTYGVNTVSSRLQLQTVQECSATNCFPPTTIAYQSGGKGWSAPQATTVAETSPLVGSIVPIDLNGDGLTDMLYPVASNGNVQWWVAFATPTGFQPGINTGIVSVSAAKIIPGTFSGNGRNQFLIALTGGTGNWTLYSYNNSSFVPLSTGLAAAGEQLAVDWDGDGLTDLAVISGVTNAVSILRNTTSPPGTVSFAAPVQVFTYSSGMTGLMSPNTVADFDGDGRGDLLLAAVVGSSQQWIVLESRGFGAAPSSVGLAAGTDAHVVAVGDYNGDRCTDIFGVGVIYISTCNGPGLFNVIHTSMTFALHLFAVDWDGDGRTDLLYYNNTDTNYNLYVFRSTGDATIGGPTLAVSGNSTTQWFTFDSNGDGMQDLALADFGTDRIVKVMSHAQANKPADFATSFTDGLGMNQNPTYVPISQNNYSKYADASFPEMDYQGPLYVVDQYTASDGTGSNYQQQFWYYGARAHIQGRGFEGFYAKRAYDTRNALYTYDYYNRAFPTTGMHAQTTVTTGTANTQVWTAALTSSTLTGLGGFESRYFPYAQQTDLKQYEISGSLAGSVISDTTTGFVYSDGYGNANTITTTTIDQDPTSPYYTLNWVTTISSTFLNDSSSAWCLGIPSTVSVQSSAPNQTSATRSYQFNADTSHSLCRIQQEVIEPSSTALNVSSTLGFDSCGNVNSISVVGHNPDGSAMAARNTTVDYGSRCQLPETITNALSQPTTIAYAYEFGVPKKITDPNTLAINRTYDDFGRHLSESRPDGTSSTFSYYYCNVAPCWGVNDLRFSVYENDYASDGTLAFSKGQYWDGYGRLRYDQSTHAFGTLVYDEIAGYDSLGRRVYEYQPVSSGSNGYVSYAYDLLNRPTLATLYQSNGSQDRFVEWQYSGRTTTFTDALSANQTRITDVMGYLRQVSDPSPSALTQYEYDAFGNLNRITDAIGAVSTASYDVRGCRTSNSDADQGAWTFKCDSLGEVVSWTDAKLQSFGAAYDPLGRLTSRSEAEGTSSWTWGNSAAAHNIGSLASRSSTGFSEVLSYDLYGRLQTRSISTDQSYQYDYAYNIQGLLDTVTYPCPTTSTCSTPRLKIQYGYSYGQAISLSDVTNGTPGTSLWTQTSVNDFASPLVETLGTGTNAISIASTYKTWTNELIGLQSGTSSAPTGLQNLAYTWDNDGSLTERWDKIPSRNLKEDFFYDALRRLKSSTLNGVQNVSLSYLNSSGVDRAGNITNKSDVGTYSYGDTLHPHGVTAAGSSTFAYDKNGNVVTRNGLAQTWTSFNLPSTLRASVSGTTYSASFSYGPDHERFSQSATYSNGTENTAYAGGLFEKITGTALGGKTDYRHYVTTPTGLTVIINRLSDGTSSTTYALSDHLGSTDAVVNASTAALNARESYSAFGQRRGSSWAAGSPTTAEWSAIGSSTRQGFTFHSQLDNIGLIHMNGRVYDPTVGRFLSADPVVSDILDSQSVNPFSYVGNRPMSFVDPDGFCCDDAGGNASAPAEVVVQGSANQQPLIPSIIPNGTPSVTFTVPSITDLPSVSNGGSSQKAGEIDELCTQPCDREVVIIGPTVPTVGLQTTDSHGATFEVTRVVPMASPYPGDLVAFEITVSVTPGRGSMTTTMDQVASAVSNLVFKGLIHPAFGWIDCALVRCTPAQTALAFAGPAIMVVPIGKAANLVGRLLVARAAPEVISTGTNIVYRSVNAAGEVQYVGITNNLARRAAEHLSSKGIQITRLMSGLSRADAKSVEQALIEIHGLARNGGTLLNKINSIAKSNPKYAASVKRGYELLHSIGYK